MSQNEPIRRLAKTVGPAQKAGKAWGQDRGKRLSRPPVGGKQGQMEERDEIIAKERQQTRGRRRKEGG